jgi:hypothetical protein
MNGDVREMRQYVLDDSILGNILIGFSFGGPDGMALSVDLSVSSVRDSTSIHYGYDRMEWGKASNPKEALDMNWDNFCNARDRLKGMKQGTKQYICID